MTAPGSLLIAGVDPGAPVVEPPPVVIITAVGAPVPQGSKKHVGNGVMIESAQGLERWRNTVKAAALLARIEQGTPPPLDEPLEVSMIFTIRKPVSAPKRRRSWPSRKPDLSKLIRAAEDALTDAGTWADDARAVAYRDTRKVFPGEHPLALDVPGVIIRIWQVTT
jgi:Holliday junction resolvase RusA-like endonuclease